MSERVGAGSPPVTKPPILSIFKTDERHVLSERSKGRKQSHLKTQFISVNQTF